MIEIKPAFFIRRQRIRKCQFDAELIPALTLVKPLTNGGTIAKILRHDRHLIHQIDTVVSGLHMVVFSLIVDDIHLIHLKGHGGPLLVLGVKAESGPFADAQIDSWELTAADKDRHKAAIHGFSLAKAQSGQHPC